MPMRAGGLDRRLCALLILAAGAAAACGDDKKGGAATGGSAGSVAGKSGSESAGKDSGGTAGSGGGVNDGDAAGNGAKAGEGGGGGGKGGTASSGSGSGGESGGGEEAGAGGVGPGGAGSGGEGGESRGGGGEGGADPVQVECGNGVKEAGEECEPPSSSTCTERCQTISTQACVDCEQAGACTTYSSICTDNFAAEDERSICYEVLKCVQDSNCADGSNAVQHCFCGTLDTGACSAAPANGNGAPNGACAAIIREAVSQDGSVATSAEVLTRLIDESLPGGAALARVNCDRQDPACIATCGY